LRGNATETHGANHDRAAPFFQENRDHSAVATYLILHIDPIAKDDEVASQRLAIIEQHLASLSNANGNSFLFRAPRSREDVDALAQQIEDLVPTADFLLTLRQPVPARMIELGTRLRLIQKLGMWYDTIDVAAAAERNIPVAVSPQYGTVNVAEHTMMLMLALSRKLIKLHNAALAAENPRQLTPLYTTQWQRYFNWLGLPGTDFSTLFGRTLGLVGLGEIGGEVAKRARAFGMNLLYTKRSRLLPDQEKALGITFVSLDELLQISDYVSLHIPHTPETEKLISERELALMKPTAFLINTSRGNIVDEEALIHCLHDGRIAGAGLDVFSTEPVQPDNPLLQLKNLVLTPHVAAAAPMLLRYQRAFENMKRVADGLPPWDRVG
jgi:phosphoglycerate dehydrogenase-like enzyme